MTLLELAELDAWLKKQCSRLKARMHPHILKGRSLDDPAYRTDLGQHQAFMRMRSYIHGTAAALRARSEHD